jgi:hypothetical protein
MSKSQVVRAVRQSQRRRGPAVVPDAVEGHIVEICRDLAVHVKRMRQLKEQAEELRVVIRQWAGQSEESSRPASREGRR